MDEKVPPRLRSSMPLLVDAEDRILWLPGLKHSGYAQVTPGTTRYLVMERIPRKLDG
ncbi:hypothetical protein N6H14_11555 [Paenibacillus sp. CC-CFT747]|nr:hypothetical protein N6H14_11555 [Paenibacillus sp. CC-CFT747]